jgi:hypothetical protein
MVYLEFCGCREYYESLSDDWFGKPSDTLEPSLWIHSPVSRLTLLLRLEISMSMVGWSVLGMHLVSVLF